MDLGAAERLASLADPKALSALQKHSADPAVARAVAEQFGAQLMQRVMQNGDGEAIGMTDGVGGNLVNSLFASTIAQAGMSGDKLGLADMLFHAIEAKQQGATPAAAASASAASAAASAPLQTAAAAPPLRRAGAGFSLSPYWQSHGMRPLGGGAASQPIEPPGSAVAGMVPPPALRAAAGLALIRPLLPSGFVPPAVAAAAPLAATPVGDGAAIADAPAAAATGASAAQIAAFTQQLAPALQRAAQQLGVSPKILLAQAALETGWGRSVVGNNVFGIKAGPSWPGAQAVAATHEVEGGRLVPQQAAFRAYPSIDAAVDDFVSLVSASRRYQAAIGLGADAQGYAQALIDGGWATDTDYPSKLAAVAAGPSVAAAFAAPDLPAPPRPAHG